MTSPGFHYLELSFLSRIIYQKDRPELALGAVRKGHNRDASVRFPL